MALTQDQRLQQFATALSKDTGLTYDASYKWASAEVGPLNNLGIQSNGGPASYATPQEGAAAAASLINSSPLYAGISATIPSNNTMLQLGAIAQSPWRLGSSGLAKAGGYDPWYAKLFGLNTAAFMPGSVGSTGTSSGPNPAATTPGSTAGAAPGYGSGTGTWPIPDILGSIQGAIGFVGILLIGLVFIIGAFLLRGHDKSQVVIV